MSPVRSRSPAPVFSSNSIRQAPPGDELQRSSSSILCGLGVHYADRAAGGVGLDIRNHILEVAAHHFLGHVAQVGGEKAVGSGAEWIIGRQGLFIVDVDGRADDAAMKGGQQRTRMPKTRP